MKFTINGNTLVFQYDEEVNQTICHSSLESWADFTSENSREECEGKNIIFVLEPEDYNVQSSLAPSEKYEAAIGWLLSNQVKARDTVLTGVMSHIETLRSEYGIDDEDLNEVVSTDQLGNMIDLSYVHIFPHSKAGAPYLGFEMECNWDPDNGCGVLIHGLSVVDTGISEAVQHDGAVLDHGGAV